MPQKFNASNSHSFYITLYRLINILTLPLALEAAMHTRFGHNHIHSFHDLQLPLLVALLSWIFATHTTHHYERSLQSRRIKTILITLTTTLIFYAFMGLFSFAFKNEGYSRIVITLLAIYQGLFVLISFFIIRALIFNFLPIQSRALIVGDIRSADGILNEIKYHSYWGIEVVGYQCDKVSTSQRYSSFPHLGPLCDLKKTIKEQGVTELFIVLSSGYQFDDILRVVDEAEKEGIKIQLLADSFNPLTTPLTMTKLGAIHTFQLRQSPLDTLQNRLIKRAMGLFWSLLGILFLLPLFAVVATLIKLADRGPVFFKQIRTGYMQKDFLCYKFRSMTVTPQHISDGQQATEGDSRLLTLGPIPLGHLIRKLNIDELPQLINVVKGEMALVGPRPHMLAHTDEFKERLEQYLVRHHVKPGITGLAQVNGFRGPTLSHHDLYGRVQYDLLYIEEWSLSLDFQILFLTFFGSKTKNNAF